MGRRPTISSYPDGLLPCHQLAARLPSLATMHAKSLEVENSRGHRPYPKVQLQNLIASSPLLSQILEQVLTPLILDQLQKKIALTLISTSKLLFLLRRWVSSSLSLRKACPPCSKPPVWTIDRFSFCLDLFWAVLIYHYSFVEPKVVVMLENHFWTLTTTEDNLPRNCHPVSSHLRDPAYYYHA